MKRPYSLWRDLLCPLTLYAGEVRRAAIPDAPPPEIALKVAHIQELRTGMRVALGNRHMRRAAAKRARR